MEVVVTAVAVRHAKLQANHHPQTSTQFFTGQMLLSKALKGKHGLV